MENISFESFTKMLESLGALGIVGTVLIGLLAGIVAKIIMPGKDPGGIILTALLGIGGSALATWIGQQFDFTITGEPSGFIAAVAGAFLILLAYRVVFRRGG